MILKINKKITVCLTGHRPKSLPWGYNENNLICKKFKERIKIIFEKLISDGFTTFLTGMAEGFDMIGAEILLDLKKKHNLQIIAIVPCLEQEKFWKPAQQERYRRILQQCDDKVILSKHYTKTCMNERNKFLVENSSLCVACWNGKPSGTGNTVRLAKVNGNDLIIINPKDFEY